MSLKITSLHREKSEIKCTGKMKIYPDGSYRIYAATNAVFGEKGWEPSGEKIPASRQRKEESAPENLLRAKRRAAAKLRDYALCNNFNWFVTLTFDKAKIDRYDINPILGKLRSWLDNRVRRKGLKYILVPELHRDGAVHFHGFFNDCAIAFVDSGTLKLDGVKAPRKPKNERQRRGWLEAGAHIVYNISEWELGFSTAIPLYGDYHAAVGYVSKYVTKETQKIGGRWYYSGGELSVPRTQLLPDLSFRELEAAGGYVVELPGFAMAVLEGKYEIDGYCEKL